jgi:hypothetical protein
MCDFRCDVVAERDFRNELMRVYSVC